MMRHVHTNYLPEFVGIFFFSFEISYVLSIFLTLISTKNVYFLIKCDCHHISKTLYFFNILNYEI